MAVTPVVHIHFGPGKLGLGLISLSGQMAEFDCHIVGHSDGKVRCDSHLEVRIATDEGVIDTHTFESATVSQAGKIDDFDPATLSAIKTAEHALITTALSTSGLAETSDLIIEVMRLRPTTGGATTVFIAGENNVGESFPALVNELTNLGVDCRPCMVNRMCFEPLDWFAEGSRIIRADPLVEWIIEGEVDTSPALSALANLEHVKFVDDVDPYELRKRWMVNGGHIALAIVARAKNTVFINLQAKKNARKVWLRQLHSMMATKLEAAHPELSGSEEYGLEHVAAWSRQPDKTIRVISRLKRADLLPFFADLDRKLGTAVRESASSVEVAHEIMRPFLEDLHLVLRQLAQYVDYEEILDGKLSLDEKRDEATVEAYLAFMGGLVDEQTANARAEELLEAFRNHRDSLGRVEAPSASDL